jgi:hypothetical protein
MVAWSEDNVIAVGTYKHIMLLHAGSLKRGRMSADLPWPSDDCPTDVEQLACETDAASCLAAKQHILRRCESTLLTFHYRTLVDV